MAQSKFYKFPWNMDIWFLTLADFEIVNKASTENQQHIEILRHLHAWLCILLTSGDFAMNVSLSLLTRALISDRGLDIHDPHIFASASDGSGGQFSRRMWSWATEWVASDAGVNWWSCLPSISRPRRGVPNWTWWGGVWTSRLERKLIPPTGVPIFWLALGCRKTLSSKSPWVKTFISYSRFRDLLQWEEINECIKTQCTKQYYIGISHTYMYMQITMCKKSRP